MERFILAMLIIYALIIITFYYRTIKFIIKDTKMLGLNTKKWIFIFILLPAIGLFLYSGLRNQHKNSKNNDLELWNLKSQLIGLFLFPIVLIIISFTFKTVLDYIR